MKKGATHVDWAISMGIFLIYVLLMFIFLKPATEPTYNGNTLLETVYTGLENDTTYTVQRGYFIIKPKDLESIPHDSEGRYNIRIKSVGAYLSEGWKSSEEQGLYHLTMFNESLGKVPPEELDGQDVDFDFTNEYCTTHTCSDADKDVLDITAKLENNENNIFWFVYSEGAIYSHLQAYIDYTNPQCQEENPPGARIRNCLLNDGPADGIDDEDFTYEFGVIETYSGFSQDKLEALSIEYPGGSEEEYQELKEKWGIPEGVQFTVNITNLSSYPIDIDYEFGATKEVIENVDVFAKEWGDWMLQEKATYLPIKISVKVWLGNVFEVPPERPPTMSTELFSIKNTEGDTVAIFDDQGNLKLEGTCSFGGTCNPTGYSFEIENNAGDVVAYIDENGNLCLESGDCGDRDESCDTSVTDGLLVQNSLGITVAYIDTSGQLCLKGSLIQGSGS